MHGQRAQLLPERSRAPLSAGTAWTLGAVGTVRWEGVRLARRSCVPSVVSRDAVSVQATGLDPSLRPVVSTTARCAGRSRSRKALDDALLPAWEMNGGRLLLDHGYPLRLVLPGWVGIASIKWLGSLEVLDERGRSPWNTRWYRIAMEKTTNPVRSAWELPGAEPSGGAGSS